MTARTRRPVRPELSTKSWRQTRELQKRREPACRACGATINLVAAHKTPAELYDGSHDDLSNLMTLCVSCNAQQANLTLEQWNRIRATRRLPPVPANVPPIGWTPVRGMPELGRTIFTQRVRPKVVR